MKKCDHLWVGFLVGYTARSAITSEVLWLRVLGFIVIALFALCLLLSHREGRGES